MNNTSSSPIFGRVLVTGGSGFIGTNLINALLSCSEAVKNLDIQKPRNPAHQPLWVQTDLCNRDKVKEVIANFAPEVILHLGARTDLNGTALSDYRANDEGTKNLLDAIAGCSSVKRVIHASSMLVCELGYIPRHDEDYRPSTVYGQSKVEMEKMIRERWFAMQPVQIILRPTSIWGPWFGRPYRDFFDMVMAGRYIHPKKLKTLRSYGYVGNAVQQIIGLMTATADTVNRKTFYLADYQPTDLYQWACQICDALGKPHPKQFPAWLFTLMAYAGDGLKMLGWKNPPLTRFRLKNMYTSVTLPTEKLQKITGALLYTTEQGIRETLSWLNASSRAQ